jgi:hypothetical protein
MNAPLARWSVVLLDGTAISPHASADEALAAARDVSRQRPYAGVCVVDATYGEAPPRRRVVAFYVDGAAL